MKRIGIFIIAIALVLSSACISSAVTAADNGVLKVYTTSGGLEGSYLKGFDIQGYVDGVDEPISSTYYNNGYHVFMNVNGKNGAMSDVLSGSDINTRLKNMHYEEVDGTQTIDGVSLNVKTSFVNGGEHVKLTYTVKNTTSSDVKISLATAADVQIDGDDNATIRRLENGNGLILYTLDGDNSKKAVQFAFYGKGVSGTTAIDSLWIGSWGYGYLSNIFCDNASTVSTVERTDSAFAFAWRNRDLPAGETKTYSVLMEVGEMNIPIIDLTTADNATLYMDEAVVKGTVKDADLIDTATIHYVLDNGTEKTLSPIAMDGTAKNFSIDLTSLNLPVDSTHTIKVWAIDSLNAKSNVETITFRIKETRPPVISLIHEEWMGEEGLFKLTDAKNSPEKIAKYEYKIDDGAWKDAVLDTEYAALTSTGTKTIYARAVNVSGEISDEAVKVIKLDRTEPSISFRVGDDGRLLLTGNDTHSGVAKVEYYWSESDVQGSTEPDWQPYSGTISYEGDQKGSIYLWTRVTDHAGNSSIHTEAVDPVEAPVIVAEDSFENEHARFVLKYEGDHPEDILRYEYRIGDGEWQTYAENTEVTLDGLEGEIVITARVVDLAGRYGPEAMKTVNVTFTQEDQEGAGTTTEEEPLPAAMNTNTPGTGDARSMDIPLFLAIISLTVIGILLVSYMDRRSKRA